MPMKANPRMLLIAAFSAAVLAALYVAFRPKPISVDLGRATVGPMRVAVEEEGKTRVRNVYTISAPVAGKLLRIALQPGDPVVKNETVVAVILPAAPSFLDHRARHEAEAQVAAATAAVELAEAEARQAKSELEFAESELRRSDALARSQVVSERVRERARIEVEVRKAALVRAQASVEVRRRELETARSRLIGPEMLASHPDAPGACCLEVRSPVSGQVLKRLQVSETVLAAGTPLVEIGDTSDIEIVVDLLSTDAVKIAEGALARIEGWGGPQALPARVTRIEPAGFTKVSALGIEEQRVRTILDFEGAPEVRRRLGHEYRLFVSITTWSADAALRAPLAALFRSGDRWAVFREEAGRARLVPVEVGQRNAEFAEILSGLKPGDAIVLHPSDRVGDGVPIRSR